MDAAVAVGGIALEAAAWWLVTFRRREVWRTTVPVLTILGIAVLVVGPPAWSPDVAPAVAALAGAGSGLALYLGTRIFVTVVEPWRRFRLHALAMYLRQGERSLARALVLSVVLSVPGEELFWRGFVQPEAVDALAGRAALGALVTWAAFVLANLPSANLAIVAGAVVGGAVWTGLGWWSGGAVSPMVSHVVWTTLMITFPVVRASERAA